MAYTGTQVTVTTSATALFAPATAGGDTSATGAIIRNAGSASVFLGGSAVTTSGFELVVGAVITVDAGDGATLYGICASGTVRVDVLSQGKWYRT